MKLCALTPFQQQGELKNLSVFGKSFKSLSKRSRLKSVELRFIVGHADSTSEPECEDI